MLPDTMRAAVTTAYGDAGVLRVESIPLPVPGPGDVLVRVRASSLNPVDTKMRAGALRILTGKTPPRVLGFDVAGEVAAVPGVLAADGSAFRVGERVFGAIAGARGGAHAEYAVVPALALARIPDGVTFEQAACVPVAGGTALLGVRRLGRLRTNEPIAINGASGGVGSFAVQIALALGGDVTATASAAHAGFVRGLGAPRVLDYAAEDFAGQSAAFRVIFDVHGGRTYASVRRALRRGGHFVTTLPRPVHFLSMPVARLLGHRVELAMLKPNGTDLADIGRWMQDGRVRACVDRTFPLAAIADAHRHMETGHPAGKIVVTMDA